MILFDNLFTKDVIGWGWEKNSEIQKRKQGKNPPVWLPYHPHPRLQNGGRLFSGARKHRTQAGPTLSGRRVPNLIGQKKRQGWVRYGQLIVDNMIFRHMKFQDRQQKRAGVRLEVQKQLISFISETAFVVLNDVIWLIRNIVWNLCYVCLTRKILSQKKEKQKERKTKRKIESMKIMIYVENINWIWNIFLLFRMDLLKWGEIL